MKKNVDIESKMDVGNLSKRCDSNLMLANPSIV